MNKSFFTRIFILCLLFIASSRAMASNSLTFFNTEQSSQQHCPNDVVVWLNPKSGIYHLKGERWYSKTKNGTYVCKTEADQFGNRETKNKQ